MSRDAKAKANEEALARTQEQDEIDMNKASKRASIKTVPRIAAGAGIAATSRTPGLGEALEKAMSQAMMKALEEGVTDPDEQRARMNKAREDVLRSIS